MASPFCRKFAWAWLLFGAGSHPHRNLRAASDLEDLHVLCRISLQETDCSDAPLIPPALEEDVRSVGGPEAIHLSKLKSVD